MGDLLKQVESNIQRRELLRDGQRVLVAVSGGVDSMVLLHLLRSVAKRHGWKLAVAHFNHQLRQTHSDADERLVCQTAGKLKLPVEVGRGDVRMLAAENGISLEMAARRLRHEFLAATARNLKISKVILAHHADDQVELFFLRLLRGAGGIGLAGMKWENASPVDASVSLARPLLDVPKAALLEYARANGIRFSEDATNSCLDIQRNRIRHKLIPLLTKEYQPALSGVVSRLMDVVGAEADYARLAGDQWLRSRKRQGFNTLPAAVQRSVVRRQLANLRIAADFNLVERLRLGGRLWITVDAERAVMRDEGGFLQVRTAERLEFNEEGREVLLTAGKRFVTFGGLKICWDFAVKNGTSNACKLPNLEYFDADKVGAAIRLRFWQAGDRFQPIGMKSAKKVQDLFTDLKVPAGERRRRVVAATSQGELFWVEGLRMAERFKLDHNTARRLQWSWQRQ